MISLVCVVAESLLKKSRNEAEQYDLFLQNQMEFEIWRNK